MLEATTSATAPRSLRAAARSTTLLVAGGMLLFYGSLSPGSIRSMGYGDEEARAMAHLLGTLSSWAHLQPASMVPAVTRHGLVGVLLELPFGALGAVLKGVHPLLAEAPLAAVPIVATTVLVALLFVWIRELTGDERWAWLLAVGGGIGTMLWPYAYLGMETTQSLFLLLAAAIALRPVGATVSGAPRRDHPVLFALCAGVATAVKTTGLFVLPAVVFLAWREVRRAPTGRERRRRLLLCAIVIGALPLANWLAMTLYLPPAGIAASLRSLLVVDPLAYVFHLLGFLAGANKGLIVYAPVAVVGLFGAAAALRRHRDVAVFALLAGAGLAAGYALFAVWTEETWGPRYLHSAVAPLILLVAAARGHRAPRLRRDGVVWAALGAGLVVNALGVAVYYGTLEVAMTAAGEDTLAAIQYDPAWNPVRFDAWVIGEWLRDPAAAALRPHRYKVARHWWYQRPAGATDKEVDIGALARPQPFLLRFWGASPPGLRWVPPLLLLGLLTGSGLLAAAARRVFRSAGARR